MCNRCGTWNEEKNIFFLTKAQLSKTQKIEEIVCAIDFITYWWLINDEYV